MQSIYTITKFTTKPPILSPKFRNRNLSAHIQGNPTEIKWLYPPTPSFPSPSGDFQTLVVINARSAGPLLFWAHYIVRSDQGFPTWRKKIPFFGGFPKCRYTDRLCDPMSNSLNLRTIFFTISVVGSAKEWSLGCVKHAPPRGQRRPGRGNHKT